MKNIWYTMAKLGMLWQAFLLWEIGWYPPGTLLATVCSPPAILPTGSGNLHLEIGLSVDLDIYWNTSLPYNIIQISKCNL